MARTPKKADKIEVRLPTQTKAAFLARCAAEGRSASVAVRAFIEDHLARPLNARELPMTIVRSPIAYAGLAAAALVGLLAISAPSQAEPNFTAIFKSLDADGDGFLSPGEFGRSTGAASSGSPENGEARLSANSGEMDSNKDGAVSLAEFSAFNRASMIKRFLALDTDSDGGVTLAEMQRPGALLADPGSGFAIAGRLDVFFARFDANRDGAITEGEFTALP